MSSALELQGYSEARAERRVARIHAIIARILNVARERKIPTWQAAQQLAEQRLASIARIKLPYLPASSR